MNFREFATDHGLIIDRIESGRWVRVPTVSKPCIKCGSAERTNSGECKPCLKIRQKKWYEMNREKALTKASVWYSENKEKAIARVSKWQKENKDKVNTKNEKWRSLNKDKVAEKNKNWKLNNKPLVNIQTQNYRARKRNSSGKLSSELSGNLFKLQRGKCACCGLPLGNDYHLDHIMPLALGGSNGDCNIQLLRAKCNLQKSAKHPVDFMQSKGKLL